MEKFIPQADKRPAARIMNTQEMLEVEANLDELNAKGQGDPNVDPELKAQLDAQIEINLAKKPKEELEQELFGDSK